MGKQGAEGKARRRKREVPSPRRGVGLGRRGENYWVSGLGFRV